MSAITRRWFGRTLGGAMLSISGAGAPFDRLSWSQEGGSAQALERHYRADAQVTVLGVSLFHREGVGGGSVLWRESSEAGGVTLRLLEFNGYSLPARAAGLNRLGFIREMCRVVDAKSVESIYFGLMTASPEESAAQARGALQSTAKEQAYTVIDGRVVPSGSEASVAQFAAPASLSALQRPELVERAHKSLAAEAKVSGGPAPHDEAQSFLEGLAGLLLRPDRSEGSYVYSGHVYSLWVDRAVDVKATAYFRTRKLIPPEGNVIRVAGRLRRQAGGKETDFRLWVEQASGRPVPLRIEYQAKSYLRLVFEAEVG